MIFFDIYISHTRLTIWAACAIIQQNQVKPCRWAVADIYTVVRIMPAFFKQFVACQAAQGIFFFAANAQKAGDFDIIGFVIGIFRQYIAGSIRHTAVVVFHHCNVGLRQFVAQFVFNRGDEGIGRCVIYIFF